jgi:hypothetical protein
LAADPRAGIPNACGALMIGVGAWADDELSWPTE